MNGLFLFDRDKIGEAMYDSYAAILKKNLLKRRETITPFSRPGRISIVTWAKHATAIVASVDSFDSTISVAA